MDDEDQDFGDGEDQDQDFGDGEDQDQDFGDDGGSDEERQAAQADEIQGLRTLLSAALPDLDIDAELGNVAYKRDGTPIYVGKAVGQPPRSNRRHHRGGRPSKTRTPDLDSMTDEEFMKYTDREIEKGRIS